MICLIPHHMHIRAVAPSYTTVPAPSSPTSAGSGGRSRKQKTRVRQAVAEIRGKHIVDRTAEERDQFDAHPRGSLRERPRHGAAENGLSAEIPDPARPALRGFIPEGDLSAREFPGAVGFDDDELPGKIKCRGNLIVPRGNG